jgi:hypothetical protein
VVAGGVPAGQVARREPLRRRAERVEEIVSFYLASGFRTTFRQERPNGYAIVAREDLQLHFFSMDGFIAADSYGSCLVGVPDAGELYAAFRDGLRARCGRVPASGIPRLTRPRKKEHRVVGFALIDPGGNWIRIFEQARAGDPAGAGPRATTRSALATAMRGATMLGDSKGDPQAAARLLDKALARPEQPPPADLIAALVYRAELAINLGDHPAATAFLNRMRAVPLDEQTRAAVSDDIERAADLTQTLTEPG